MTTENEILSTLRDRLSTLAESSPSTITQRQRAMHIEHLEDLPLEFGSRGMQAVIDVLSAMRAGAGNLSVKFDGKPAIVVGRNNNSEFILTDKSAFASKSYNGLATTAQELEGIMRRRNGERDNLVNMYNRIWEPLSQVVPKDFCGYIQGDLLWSEKPKLVDEKWVFKPNTVDYSVDAKSEMGKLIAQSQVGVVFHTTIDQTGATTPLTDQPFHSTASVVVMHSGFDNTPKLNINQSDIDSLNKFINQWQGAIDKLLSPEILRELKIVDFPKTFKKYVNFQVKTTVDNVNGYYKWLTTENLHENKIRRMIAHVQANEKALHALMTFCISVRKIKSKLIHDLNQIEYPIQASIGSVDNHQEGFVYSYGEILVKLVDRLTFSRSNFLNNGNI